MTANHTTTLEQGQHLPTNAQAAIKHTLVNNSFVTTVGGTTFNISRDSPDAHRYSVRPALRGSSFSLAVQYGLEPPSSLPSFDSILSSSEETWKSYWATGGFVDVVTGSTDALADELQRRIILSQYLLRVNEAGDYPPQEVSMSDEGQCHPTNTLLSV